MTLVVMKTAAALSTILAALVILLLPPLCNAITPTPDGGLEITGDVRFVGNVALIEQRNGSSSAIFMTDTALVLQTKNASTLTITGSVDVTQDGNCPVSTGVFGRDDNGVFVICSPSGGQVEIRTAYTSELKDQLDGWRSCSLGDVAGAKNVRVRTSRIDMAKAALGYMTRTGFVLTPHKGQLLLAGGRTGSATEEHLNDVWSSKDRGHTWTQLTDNAGWQGRMSFGFCGNDNMVRIVAGSSCGDRGLLNDIWTSVDGGATWKQETTTIGSSRFTAFTGCALLDDDRILMHEGCLNNVNVCGPGHCDYERGILRITLSSGSVEHMDRTPVNSGRAYVEISGTAASHVVFSGGHEAGGSWPVKGDVYISTNGGTSWSLQSVPWATTGVNQKVVVFDGFDIGHGAAGLYVRSPGSSSWREIHDQDGNQVINGLTPIDSGSFGYFASGEEFRSMVLQCQ